MIFISSNEATAAAIGKFCNVPSAMIPFLSTSLIFDIFDGIHFVGPEPPIPKRIFNSSYLILKFFIAFNLNSSLI